MKTLAAIFTLLAVSFAQSNAPGTSRTVHWDASAPGATKETQKGRIQKNVRSNIAEVSALAEITNARRFVDPPMEGGYDVACIVIGIQNTSKQTLHIDPSLITVRVVGKKEQQLKRLEESQVIDRAWMVPDRSGSALSGFGMTAGGAGASTGISHNSDVALEAAVTGRETVGANRRLLESAAQQTGPQTAKLKERALAGSDLEPGQTIQGLLFFLPYDDKDQVEVSIPVGDTTFVIPFSGRKAKR
jgi:hypothetical protein